MQSCYPLTDQKRRKSSFQKEGPLSNGREEFTERAAAFYAALGQGAPVDEKDSFVDLEPDIFEEERHEIVVHDD